MTTALILGSADCLEADLLAYSGPIDLVVACNDAGSRWPGQLDGWVSFHPEGFLHEVLKCGRGWWLEARAARGHPAPKRLFGHMQADRGSYRACLPDEIEFTDYRFPGQKQSGSSGLFAAKVALIDMGADDVVFCGVPMTASPHFFGGDPWNAAATFHGGWTDVAPEYLARMRSMSGWTREFLEGGLAS